MECTSVMKQKCDLSKDINQKITKLLHAVDDASRKKSEVSLSVMKGDEQLIIFSKCNDFPLRLWQ